MVKAYSYLRFSTPEQARGDSLRRQLDLATKYAKAHRLELDTTLSLRDLGVSAYRGKNAVEGALGRFIEAVDSGRVEKGSYLLVENLDRLSRDRIMPALNRFSSLLEKGIAVVTLSDQKVYTEESLNNLPELMLSLLIMSRAHEESKLKGERVGAAWARKRERAAAEGKPLTAKTPAWLFLKDGKYVLIPEKASIIQYIFKLALEGHAGSVIARRLNKERVPCFSERATLWHPRGIWKLLHDERVIGVFQPMQRVASGHRELEPSGPPIEDYFPAVVSKEDFYRLPKRPAAPKAHHPFKNILSGITHCAKCGSKLNYKTSNGIAYLACDGKRKGICSVPGLRYEEAGAAVTSCLRDEDIDARNWITSRTNGKQKTKLADQKEKLEASIVAIERQRDTAIDTLLRVPSKALENRLRLLEKALADQQAKLKDTEAKLREAGREGDTFGELQALIDTMQKLQRGSDQDWGEIRAKMNAALKRSVDRIELEPIEGGIGVRLHFSGVEEPLEAGVVVHRRKKAS